MSFLLCDLNSCRNYCEIMFTTSWCTCLVLHIVCKLANRMSCHHEEPTSSHATHLVTFNECLHSHDSKWCCRTFNWWVGWWGWILDAQFHHISGVMLLYSSLSSREVFFSSLTQIFPLFLFSCLWQNCRLQHTCDYKNKFHNLWSKHNNVTQLTASWKLLLVLPAHTNVCCHLLVCYRISLKSSWYCL